jgi:hypothetical protein
MERIQEVQSLGGTQKALRHYSASTLLHRFLDPFLVDALVIVCLAAIVYRARAQIAEH